MNKSSVALFDFDDTLYRGIHKYVILDFPEVLEKEGKFPSELIKRFEDHREEYKKNKKLYPGDENNRNKFARDVIKTYAEGIKDLSLAEVQEISSRWVAENNGLYPFTPALIQLMNSNDKETIIVSGSPVEVLQAFQSTLHFSQLYGTKFRIDQEGKFSGTEDYELASKKAKRDLMNQLTFDRLTSFAFGDSDSDYPLLEAVDPKNAFLLSDVRDETTEHALLQGWNVLHHDDDVVAAVKARMEELSLLS